MPVVSAMAQPMIMVERRVPTASGWAVSIVLIAAGAALLLLWKKNHKLVAMIFGFICLALGLCGILEVTGLLSGVPILAFGIPAVLSCYFDLFSGFVQAYVFTLLTMVYISGSLPEPESVKAAE